MRPNEQDVAERGRGSTGAGPGPEPRDGALLAAITMPAAEVFVSFARLATAHVGGALGLSVGRVADLRLAVDEACGQFMQGPTPFRGAPAPLHLRYDRRSGTLLISVSGPIPSEWPDRDGLSWLVLDSLVSDVRCRIGPPEGVGTLTFVEHLSTDEASRDTLWFAAP